MTVDQLHLNEGDRYYVYVLARPDGSVFYVGKGCKDRVSDHEREAYQGCVCDKCQVIRNIWRVGGKVIKRIIFRTDDEHEALCYEGRLIREFRSQLTNKKRGRERQSSVSPLIQDVPPILRAPRQRMSKKDEEQARLVLFHQRQATYNLLYSRWHAAVRKHKSEYVEWLEDQMEALEILMSPGIVEQLKLDDI